MAKLELTIGSRKVYWDLTEDQAAIMAQNLVQSFRPADGDVADKAKPYVMCGQAVGTDNGNETTPCMLPAGHDLHEADAAVSY